MIKPLPWLSVVAAVTLNNAIGHNNELLFRVTDDLRRFKQLTLNSSVIMGRKTFESLPNGALPNRVNIVLTQNTNYKAPNCTVVTSVPAALKTAAHNNKAFVIGGAQIYELLLPYASTIYLTVFETITHGDAFFPEILPTQWNIVEETAHANSAISWRYVTYKRVKQL